MALPLIAAVRAAPAQGAATTPMDVIDTHTHTIFNNPQYHYPHDFSADDLVRLMDASGVAKAIIVQSQSGNGIDSPYPAQQAARHPDRLISVCGLDVLGDEAATVLRSRVRDWNASGVRTFWERVDPNEARFEPIWLAAVELRLPVLISGEATYEHLPPLFERYRDIQFVLDHIGQPDLSNGIPDGLSRLAGHENLFLKFSSYVIEHAQDDGMDAGDLLAWLVDTFGADKLMWGSNYPSSHEPRWSYSACVETMRSMVASYEPEQQRQILSRTAISVWPALAGSFSERPAEL